MIKIGIICPSEIAFRRFLPSLQKANKDFTFVAIAIASPEEWFDDLNKVSIEDINYQQKGEMVKAQSFVDNYGGEIVVGYNNLVISNDIDAIYIPLPPALHYHWAKKALKAGKHVFVEKPSTTNLADTDDLIKIAKDNKLALHENYMFIYHNQIEALSTVVKKGEIGDVRLYRISFGFPLRQLNDFRYNKELGGGALLDAGGYCLKYGNYLLGGDSKIITAQANNIDGFEVEMYGSATMKNENGDIAQIAFGMDNDYRCDIEIWGSKGTITSNRILTAPAGFIPSYTIKKNQIIENHNLPVDDAFFKSIQKFSECIQNADEREKQYKIIHNQEDLVEQFKSLILNHGEEK